MLLQPVGKFTCFIVFSCFSSPHLPKNCNLQAKSMQQHGSIDDNLLLYDENADDELHSFIALSALFCLPAGGTD
jgi:hypothetical protein